MEFRILGIVQACSVLVCFRTEWAERRIDAWTCFIIAYKICQLSNVFSASLHFNGLMVYAMA